MLSDLLQMTQLVKGGTGICFPPEVLGHTPPHASMHLLVEGQA